MALTSTVREENNDLRIQLYLFIQLWIIKDAAVLYWVT